MKKLSIIIPIKNMYDYLPRALDSIKDQYIKDGYEIIIINDQSEKSHQYILNNYKNLPIIYIDNLYEIKGPGTARQTGIDTANGEWITFLDADDYFLENSIQYILDYINTNNIHNILISGIISVEEENNFPLDNNTSWMHGKFFEKEFIDKYNLHFNKSLYTNEDVNFNLQLIITADSNGLDIADISGNFYSYGYCYNPDSLTRQEYYINNCKVTYPIYYRWDYIEGTLKEFFKAWIDTNQEQWKIQVLNSFLFLYNEYQFCHYINNNYGVELNELKDILKRFENSINESFLELVYSNPQNFVEVRDIVICNEGYYIDHETIEQWYKTIIQ